ncbi:hypothetical protein [Sphingomonas nostoxanthinifaciens]|uniref:hypothetical protein n=1 Tax=Sphingomonas nostoxanthinifaciens TaxID=2872652 RepID=UPI001CC1C8AA|nr:hypothetical protein [Sphingomonas nostoxanthinifaciens]UAK24523.1 hypothetical protein K8P63_19830 [Sphingomonas nostoxanthinifaciens]
MLDRQPFATAATLGYVDTLLTRALARIGFVESGRYRVPGGFVLVTRMERFRPDGTSWAPDRFTIDDSAAVHLGSFSLGDYLRALFTAPEGQYRVLAFVVTDQPVTQTGSGLSADAASELVSSGATDLPETYARLRFTPAHRVVALVYEFRRVGSAQPSLRLPSDLQGLTHLQQVGLLHALGE